MQSLTEKSTILIIEDNPLNVKIVVEHLKSDYINIIIAANGEKGINLAKTVIPDLILLDIGLPDIDGFEVIKSLKSDTNTATIPVIFLTAQTGSEIIAKCFESGASDYLAKPFNSVELVKRVVNNLQMRNYQKLIIQDKENLERLNIEKNEFLGIAAHDLKNPIFGIQMLAKLIRDINDLSSEERIEFSNDIITSCDRMIGIITKLLDLNAIESGKIKINLQQYNIKLNILEIIKSYKVKAEQKKITLNFENNSDSEVYTDLFALMQILENLISNAIKFTESDKNVYLKLFDKDDKLLISIRDEGLGMNENDMKNLFKKFSKLSARPTGGEHSTGLGLSIVKKYIDEVGGTIEVKSKVNEGSEFIISFPKSGNNPE